MSVPGRLRRLLSALWRALSEGPPPDWKQYTAEKINHRSTYNP